jgi:hypothetical protein
MTSPFWSTVVTQATIITQPDTPVTQQTPLLIADCLSHLVIQIGNIMEQLFKDPTYIVPQNVKDLIYQYSVVIGDWSIQLTNLTGVVTVTIPAQDADPVVDLKFTVFNSVWTLHCTKPATTN